MSFPSVPEAFAVQVSRNRSRIAVKGRQHRLTYEELDHASSALAEYLESNGVGFGDVLPIRLRRDASLPVAMLGALKLGAAFSVLDPSWPLAFCESVAQRAGARGGRILGASLSMPELTVLLSSKAAGSLPVESHATAAIVMTSGSSGVSKAAAIPHHGITRLFGESTAPLWGAQPIIPAASAVAWDGFSWELWGALLNGGTAIMVSEGFLDTASISELVSSESVDTVFLITSLFNANVEADVEAFQGLKRVHFAGEAPSIRHIRRFQQAHPDVELYNLYGPAEFSIGATAHRITRDDLIANEVPIGLPLPGTRVAIEAEGMPLNQVDSGELLLGGAGLFSGYVNDGSATESVIIVDSGGDLWYRTGDLVRRRSDGGLVFLGRRDHQVKLNGYRIELEGVENALRQVGGVEDAVAFVARSRAGYPYLAAVVAATGIGGEFIRRTLRSESPEYLVPTRVHIVEALPRMANGKPDRGAALLLAEESDEADAVLRPRSLDTPPYPDQIERVRRVFAAVLGQDCDAQVGFLEAGGTSVQFPRLAAALRSEFGRQVRIPDLVRWSTPTQIARELA